MCQNMICQFVNDGNTQHVFNLCIFGRGKNGGIVKNRLVTIKYEVHVENGVKKEVCKALFMNIFGVSRGKLDVIVQKKRSVDTGIIPPDNRGKHQSTNKLTEERAYILQFIEKFPKYESHYGRRHTDKKYLANNLNLSIFYDLYKDERTKANHKPASIWLFSQIFNETGYKFKSPQIDRYM